MFSSISPTLWCFQCVNRYSCKCQLNVTTLTKIKSISESRDAYVRERRRPARGTARVILSARDRGLAFYERRERKGRGVRTKRIRASFVTRRDVSGKTSGRKQLDDLSTPGCQDTANDFIDIFSGRKSARPRRDRRQMVRTYRIEGYVFQAPLIGWARVNFLTSCYILIRVHI